MTPVFSGLASLYYGTPGNLGNHDTAGNPDRSGWGLGDTGPFSNIQEDFY